MQEPRIQQFFPRTAEKFFRPAVRLDQPVVSRIHDQDCFRSHLHQHPETGLALVQRLQRLLLRSDVFDDRKKVAGGTRILVSHRSEHNSDPGDAPVFPDYPFLHRGSGDFACQQTAAHQIRCKIFGMDYVLERLANQFISRVADDLAQAMADHRELAIERQMSHAKPNQCERREEWLFVLPQGDAVFVGSVRHWQERSATGAGGKQYKSEIMFNASEAMPDLWHRSCQPTAVVYYPVIATRYPLLFPFRDDITSLLIPLPLHALPGINDLDKNSRQKLEFQGFIRKNLSRSDLRAQIAFDSKVYQSVGKGGSYGLVIRSGFYPLSTTHYPLTCLSKSFPCLHSGCGRRIHNDRVLALHRYRAGPHARKCTRHTATRLNQSTSQNGNERIQLENRRSALPLYTGQFPCRAQPEADIAAAGD